MGAAIHYTWCWVRSRCTRVARIHPRARKKAKQERIYIKKTMAGLTRRDENSAEDAQAGGPVHGWDARRVHCPPFPGIGSFTDEPRRPSPGRFAFMRMFSRFWLYNYWWVCACIPLVIFRLKVCRPTVHGTITSKQRLVFFFSWHYRSWQSMFCGREIEVRCSRKCFSTFTNPQSRRPRKVRPKEVKVLTTTS